MSRRCLAAGIIDKLPFPPPGTRWSSPAQRLESQGRSAFNDYRAEAAVRSSRGGRLIRRESDQACWSCAKRGWPAWAMAVGCWQRCRRCAAWVERRVP